MTLDDVAKWHREAQHQYEQSEALARGAERIGNEDAGFIADGWKRLASRHAEMALTIEVTL